MPRSPWSRVHIDLCGPLPTGENLLVVIDAATRWPEVEILRSTTATTIISRLDRIFAQHGYPDEIVSDNGPQFISREFADYMKSTGIDHRRVTPYHPQANAEVERFNSTLLKAIRTARNSGRDWHHSIFAFLLAYRSTPHPATKATPAKLLYNREISTKLPSPRPVPRKAFANARRHDRKYKAHMKSYHDGRKRFQNRVINQGDHVLITQRKNDKFTSRYDPNPWIVTSVKGGSVKMQRGRENTMRYMSQIRKVPNSQREYDPQDDLQDDFHDDHQQRDQEQRNNPTPENAPRRSQRNARPPDRLTYYRSGVIM